MFEQLPLSYEFGPSSVDAGKRLRGERRTRAARSQSPRDASGAHRESRARALEGRLLSSLFRVTIPCCAQGTQVRHTDADTQAVIRATRARRRARSDVRRRIRRSGRRICHATHVRRPRRDRRLDRRRSRRPRRPCCSTHVAEGVPGARRPALDSLVSLRARKGRYRSSVEPSP